MILKYSRIPFFILVAVMTIISSCGDDVLIPKPPTYLRANLPAHEYRKLNDNCPYSFELSKYFSYKNVVQGTETTCHKDIDLGPLNGTIHFSYIAIKEPLKSYIDYALNKVEEHQVKAESIDDQQFIRPKKHVYGTFFELKGDVASPFQFYLTDSINHFVSGVVYFNSKPNYDSLRPSLEYLKQDLQHLMETFNWK